MCPVGDRSTVSDHEIVDRADIVPPKRLEQSWFAAGGRVIDDFAAVLGAFDVRSGAVPAAALPEIVHGAVQQRPHGVIQDPAGSAVGARSLSGGGASGAIYAAFPDLRPIPNMAVGAAVFNRSSGPGRRVLHTHSPVLHGDPDDADARAAALVRLADAYANALTAVGDRADALGADGRTCNLVPVAGSIFARAFGRERLSAVAHLDPSYTLVAVIVAGASVRTDAPLPALTLCCFDADVAARAEIVRSELAALLAAG